MKFRILGLIFGILLSLVLNAQAQDGFAITSQLANVSYEKGVSNDLVIFSGNGRVVIVETEEAPSKRAATLKSFAVHVQDDDGVWQPGPLFAVEEGDLLILEGVIFTTKLSYDGSKMVGLGQDGSSAPRLFFFDIWGNQTITLSHYLDFDDLNGTTVFAALIDGSDNLDLIFVTFEVEEYGNYAYGVSRSTQDPTVWNIFKWLDSYELNVVPQFPVPRASADGRTLVVFFGINFFASQTIVLDVQIDDTDGHIVDFVKVGDRVYFNEPGNVNAAVSLSPSASFFYTQHPDKVHSNGNITGEVLIYQIEDAVGMSIMQVVTPYNLGIDLPGTLREGEQPRAVVFGKAYFDDQFQGSSPKFQDKHFVLELVYHYHSEDHEIELTDVLALTFTLNSTTGKFFLDGITEILLGGTSSFPITAENVRGINEDATVMFSLSSVYTSSKPSANVTINVRSLIEFPHYTCNPGILSDCTSRCGKRTDACEMLKCQTYCLNKIRCIDEQYVEDCDRYADLILKDCDVKCSSASVVNLASPFIAMLLFSIMFWV